MTCDLLVVQLPLPEQVLRTIAVYLFLVLALRLAGKRELAQLAAGQRRRRRPGLDGPAAAGWWAGVRRR